MSVDDAFDTFLTTRFARPQKLSPNFSVSTRAMLPPPPSYPPPPPPIYAVPTRNFEVTSDLLPPPPTPIIHQDNFEATSPVVARNIIPHIILRQVPSYSGPGVQRADGEIFDYHAREYFFMRDDLCRNQKRYTEEFMNISCADIRKHLPCDRTGLATLFCRVSAGRYFSTGKSDGFFWNPDSLLWEKITKFRLSALIDETLLFHLKRYLGFLHSRSASIFEIRHAEQLRKMIGTKSPLASYVISICGDTKDLQSKLDKTAHLLPILDGKVVDLRDGSVRDRTYEDYFTVECNVKFDPAADSTLIESFFRDICLDDEELVNTFQHMLGYSITGETSENHFYIWHGVGAGGKTTLKSLLQDLLGKFATTMHPSSIARTRTNATNVAEPFIADLEGRRMGFAPELERGSKLATAAIKHLTGGDNIKTRKLYHNAIEFVPKHKISMLCNNEPEFSVDEAMLRRIVKIPFRANFTYTPNPNDPTHRRTNPLILDRLKEPGNLSALLNWLLIGSARYYAMRARGEQFEWAQVVASATQECKDEADVYGRFLRENYLVTNLDDNRVAASDFYNVFAKWHQEQGLGKTPSVVIFGREMKQKQKLQTTKNSRIFYTGIKRITTE